MVRFYWHLSARAAVTFMAAITRPLNRRRIPFRTKVLSDPNGYGRADAGVLYLERRQAPQLGETLARVYREIASDLRPEVPLFCRPLAPGLGVAEDPGNALSFGQHRCRIAARALWVSFARGDVTPEQKAATCEEVVRAAEIDPAQPHLELGSSATYSCDGPGIRRRLSGTVGGRRSKVERTPIAKPRSAVEEPFLSAAVEIGQLLCREAIWDETGQFCNWMGRSSDESTRLGGPVFPTAVALGPDLYGGSLGVAWFLAQLGAVTGDSDLRRTALAATARSLRQFDRSSDAVRASVSYYSGLVGAAFALDRIAALTCETTLLHRIDDLLERIATGAGLPRVLDVIGGNAGAIPALLALDRDGQRPAARKLAEQLGEELLQTADRNGPVWTWARQGGGARVRECSPDRLCPRKRRARASAA